MSTMEKLLPQNVEAEAGVLGSLLIDPEAITQVIDFLRAEDFYREAHRDIYQAVLDLFESGEPADLITLTDELKRRDKLDAVGGSSYVSSLANQVPTSANVVYYARIVERTAVLRRLIQAAGQIAGIAFNEPDATVALDEAEKLIFNVAQRTDTRDAEALRTIMPPLIDDIEETQKRSTDENGQPRLLGISTGLRELDRMTTGLRGGELIVLGGRPSVGKSAVALSMAYESSRKRGTRILIFSLEMNKRELSLRLLSMASGISFTDLRTGRITDANWDRVTDAANELGNLPIYIDDTPGITLSQIRSKARRTALEQGGIDLIIVDYLQLIGSPLGAEQSGGSSNWQKNRVQEVGEFSRGLKLLAREMNIPVFALAQLSRAVESRQDKKPQLSDLRESGSIEMDADIVLFVYRDEVYNPDTERKNIADLIIAKQRNGPLATVSVFFQADRTYFRDLAIYGTVAGAADEIPEALF